MAEATKRLFRTSLAFISYIFKINTFNQNKIQTLEFYSIN